MTRRKNVSEQTLKVLALLVEDTAIWWHGYAITKEIDLRPGTLYPMLSRLDQQGYMEAQWAEPSSPGRPPRKQYRLTKAGQKLAISSSIASKTHAVRWPTKPTPS